MPTYLTGLTRPPSSGSGVGLGQAYHEKGFIRLAFGLGFERCGAGGNNCYGFSYSGGGKGNSVTIRERPAGSTGNGTEVWSSSWSSLEYDYLSTTGDGKQTNGIWYLGKDQNIKQSDGQHEYSISVSVTDSHDGGNGADIYWIPSPAPPPGPYVVVQNRTGHFTSATSATIDIALFSNPDCSGENATHVMISVDGSPWANSNTFPHTETITGAGPHNIKVKGVANTIIGKTIDYSFTLQNNDWSASRLTPVKTIVHEFPDIGKPEATGFLNLYTKNADLENKQFYQILGKNECTANANTMEIVGETQSAYSYTRTGSAIGTASQSIGGWESFEIYPDKIVGEIALGSSTYDPDTISLRIVDKTDNTSYDHSFAPPNSPWFPDSFRQHGMGSHEVEIPYTFIDGHSYEMKMYGDHWTGSHYQSLISAGPEHNGIYAINNLSLGSFKLEVSKALGSQSDQANVFTQLITTSSPLSNTVIEFADVCWEPKPTDLDYLRGNRTHGYEMCVLMCGTNGMKVYDECVIPAPIVTQCDMNSLPNSDGKYEFTSSGLSATLGVTGITTHAIRQHYYHMYFPVSGTHVYNHLPSDTAHPVSFTPEPTETRVVIDIFNSCGNKETKSFDLKYVATTINTGTVSTGGGATGTTGTHTSTTSTGDRPSFHRLIVNSTRE